MTSEKVSAQTAASDLPLSDAEQQYARGLARPRTFEPTFGQCEQHGAWQQNVVDARGTERWLAACPRCGAEKISGDLMRRTSIPLRFQDRTLDSFEASTVEQVAALGIARDYVARFDEARQKGVSLVFCGDPGTGKTHLAIGIAQRVLAGGRTAIFARAYEIIGAIRASWTCVDQDENDVVAGFSSADLLIIDEVGVQYGKESEQIELFKVINRRYDMLAPMIVISNCDLDGLKGYLGPRSYDRLREGGGRAVVFDWPSHRGRV